MKDNLRNGGLRELILGPESCQLKVLPPILKTQITNQLYPYLA